MGSYLGPVEITQPFPLCSQCVYKKSMFLKVGPCRIYPIASDMFPDVFIQKHVFEGGALWNLPTTPLVILQYSFATMKVHIKDENFITPAFLRLISTPASLFLVKQIGFGGSGPFFAIVYFCLRQKRQF